MLHEAVEDCKVVANVGLPFKHWFRVSGGLRFGFRVYVLNPKP